jgi:hypothetical protein
LSPQTAEELEREIKERRRRFLGASFGSLLDVGRAMLAEFETALDDGTEEAMQRCLTRNPYLIQYALQQSGHHGTWAFPKQMIKMTAVGKATGLIPDYLVATQSSLGYQWFVVELKRPGHQFANEKGDALSSEGNKAVVQCHAYLAHFQNCIDSVRSNVKVHELVQPQGAVLIMGRSSMEKPVQRQIRANFVDATPRVDVVTVTASMAKSWCADLQGKVADECLQLHGGYGFMREYEIARAWADARAQRIYGGTNEIMKELISRSLFPK